ncbi:MAG: YciI family protein [Aquabacterium sp.]
MQYMLLIYSSPDAEPTYGTPEFQAMLAGFAAFNEQATADGVLRGGEALKGIETATSLRLRGGKAETMDGPFAETREHLGGYYVLEVPDLDAALRYAALIPAAGFGTIEVRPLMDYNPAGN